MARSGQRIRGGDAVPAEGKWVPLRPARRFAMQMYIGLGVAAGWLLLVMPIAYIALHGAGIIAFIILGLMLLVTLLPLAFAGKALMVFRNFDDAKVSVDRETIRIGQSFKVKVEQNIRRSLHIPGMRLALLCQDTSPHTGPDGKQHSRTTTRLEKWETITRDKAVEGNKRLSAMRQFSVPSDQPPSAPPDQKDPPITRWKLRLVTAAVNGPTYDVEFPITVTFKAPAAGGAGEDEIVYVPPPEEWRRRSNPTL